MSRYEGPVVDAHHHFWEPGRGRQPWLRPGVSIPFRYGDYEALKHDYLPPDLVRDAAGLRLVGSVSMETEWDQDDPLGEVRHIEGVARRWGLPDAAVAHAVLDRPGVEGVLEELADHDLVRAVRHKPGQAPGPEGAATHPTLLDDPAWQRGFAALPRFGLDFELQTAWWHFDRAAALFARHPDTAVTVNHAGLPADRTPAGLAAWERGLRLLAAFPQVRIKVSGIGVPGARSTPAANRPVVETVAEVFGTDRILFASNFPVDGLTATYAEVYGGFLDITDEWSPAEQRAAFAGTAVAVYRLPADLLAPDRPVAAVRVAQGT